MPSREVGHFSDSQSRKEVGAGRYQPQPMNDKRSGECRGGRGLSGANIGISLEKNKFFVYFFCLSRVFVVLLCYETYFCHALATRSLHWL